MGKKQANGITQDGVTPAALVQVTPEIKSPRIQGLLDEWKRTHESPVIGAAAEMTKEGSQ